MSFDNSRFTFDPWNNYSGLVIEQGRVQLDSEWNEWMAQLARRIRAGTLDTLGQAVVPLTTSDGFKIELQTLKNGETTFKIGPGRMYVDGLLAENHGRPAPDPQKWIPQAGAPAVPAKLPGWDGHLDELTGKRSVDYDNQPYYPGCGTTAPFSQCTGPGLVYLDVWQRDVTFLENPDLVEKAVGIDTTGRIQTVWQVKWLDVSAVPGVTCSTPDSHIPAWAALLRRPGARLTSGLVPSASAGPCCLSPNTGYTGPENQLYRVEIHRPGPSGTATFKWSRDNASVATGVTAIAPATNPSASVLTVQSTGRDTYLSFLPGNWVELIDDVLELNGLPGELHQIAAAGVDAGARTITLTTAVGAANFPLTGGQTDPSRHTRIRRWDQAGKIYETDSGGTQTQYDNLTTQGDIPVPKDSTVMLVLENGITAAFQLDAGGSEFRTGDFWNFAARAADGTVEFLDRAPPRGIFHHFARLAVIGFASNSLPDVTAHLWDDSTPPVDFLDYTTTDTGAWQKNFGVSVRRASNGQAGYFDLGVVYNPAGGGAGVTLPVTLELFKNLSLDQADARYASIVINSSSNLITVPGSYTPPNPVPAFSLPAAFPATPGAMLTGASATVTLSGALGLTVQPTDAASWPLFFGVAARADNGTTSGNLDLEVFYLPIGADPVQVELFSNLSLSGLAAHPSPFTSAFAAASVPAAAAGAQLELPDEFQALQAGLASNALPGARTLDDENTPPIEFLEFTATDPTKWPKSFGVSVKAPTTPKPGFFDLEVVYDLSGGGVGVTPPVALETFPNLSFDPSDPSYAPTVINAGSKLIAVPGTYGPPSPIPTLSLPPSYPATPGGKLSTTAATKIPVGSASLTVGPTDPAGWPVLFGVAAQTHQGSSPGNFDLEVFYRPMASAPVQVELFSNLSLAGIKATAPNSTFAKIAVPLGVPAAELKLPDGFQGGQVNDCRQFWPSSDECACTACVTVDSHRNGTLTIQMAVNQVVAAGGGTVCIGPGAFFLDATVAITSTSATTSLTIRGQGVATQLTEDLGVAAAFELTAGTQNVCIEDLALNGAQAPATTGFLVDAGCQSVVLRNLAVSGFATGASFSSGENFAVECVTVSQNTGTALAVGSAGAASQNVRLKELNLSTLGAAVILESCTGVEIAELALPAVGSGLEIVSCASVTLADLVMTGTSTGTAVAVTSSSKGIVLREINVTSNGPVLSIDASGEIAIENLFAATTAPNTVVALTGSCSDVTLRGLQISGGAVGVEVAACANVTIRDLAVAGVAGTTGGVTVDSSSGVTVENFSMTGAGAAAAVTVGSSHSQSASIVLRELSFAGSGPVIAIDSTTDVTIETVYASLTGGATAISFTASQASCENIHASDLHISGGGVAVAVASGVNITIAGLSMPENNGTTGCVTIDSSTGVTVDGLFLTGTRSVAAIAVTSAKSQSRTIVLRELSVTGACPAVTVARVQNATIENVYASISGAADAVTVDSSSNVTVENIFMTGAGSGTAVVVTSTETSGGQPVQSQDLVLRRISVSNAGAAIAVDSSTAVTVETVSATLTGTATAILLTAKLAPSGNLSMTGLLIDGGGVAVAISLWNQVSIRDLSIPNSNGAYNGLTIDSSTGVTVENLSLTGTSAGTAVVVTSTVSTAQSIILRGISVTSLGAAISIDSATDITLESVVANLTGGSPGGVAPTAISFTSTSSVSQNLRASALRLIGTGPAFSATVCLALQVRDMVVLYTGEKTSASSLISVTECFLATLQDVQVEAASLSVLTVPLVLLTHCFSVSLERVNLLTQNGPPAKGPINPPALGLAGLQLLTSIRECSVTATVGIGVFLPTGGPPYLYAEALTVADAVVNASQAGILFDGQLSNVIFVAQNRITGCSIANSEAAIAATAVTVADGSIVEIDSNTITACPIGIVASAISLRIHHNVIAAGASPGGGIAITPGPGLGVDFCQITGNQIVDIAGPAISFGTAVGEATVSGNLITGTQQGITFQEKGSAVVIAIEGNQISAIAGAREYETAIRVVQAVSARITNNTISGVNPTGDTLAAVGIQVVACGDLLVAGNQVAGIGPATRYLGACYGIQVYGPLIRASIQGNQVRRDPGVLTTTDSSVWTALFMETAPKNAVLLDANFSLSSNANNTILSTGAANIFTDPIAMGPVSVVGNRFEARGGSEIVLIQTALSDCGFSDNQCVQYSPGSARAVSITASTCTCSSNRVKTPSKIAISLTCPAPNFAVVGNIASGVIAAGSPPATLAAPWQALNVNA